MSLENKVKSIKYDPDITPAETVKPYVRGKNYESGSSHGPTRGTGCTDNDYSRKRNSDYKSVDYSS